MIRLRVEKESDFYNSLDPSNMRISEDVYAYLKTFCIEIEAQPELHDTIQILCSEPFDAERAKQSLVDAVDREQKRIDYQIMTNRRRMRVAYLIGAALSVLKINPDLERLKRYTEPFRRMTLEVIREK